MSKNLGSYFRTVVRNAYTTLKYKMWMKYLRRNRITFEDLVECLNFETQLNQSDSLNWNEVEDHVDNFFNFKMTQRDRLETFPSTYGKKSKPKSTKKISFANSKNESKKQPLCIRKKIKGINKPDPITPFKMILPNSKFESSNNTKQSVKPENTEKKILANRKKSKEKKSLTGGKFDSSKISKRSNKPKSTEKKLLANRKNNSEKKSLPNGEFDSAKVSKRSIKPKSTEKKSLANKKKTSDKKSLPDDKFNSPKITKRSNKLKSIEKKSLANRKKNAEKRSIFTRNKTKSVNRFKVNDELGIVPYHDSLNIINRHDKIRKSKNKKIKAKFFKKKGKRKLPLFARKNLKGVNNREFITRPSLAKALKEIGETTKNFFNAPNERKLYELKDYKEFLIKLNKACKAKDTIQNRKDNNIATTPRRAYERKGPKATPKGKKTDFEVQKFENPKGVKKKDDMKNSPQKNKERVLKRGFKRHHCTEDFNAVRVDCLSDNKSENLSLANSLKRRRVSSTIKIPWPRYGIPTFQLEQLL
ncbi:microtubule-associated protein 1B-like [Teleopsis dalmanni]|uniref:microtubule-associated protein 1B-like n=1 Tax=Teleopsis dalmanni TaxID=139649 RepID=UPI0018CE0DC9|nr:microtubule-associated protein 1B-like [Teleopsis dalmanni]